MKHEKITVNIVRIEIQFNIYNKKMFRTKSVNAVELKLIKETRVLEYFKENKYILQKKINWEAIKRDILKEIT